MLLVLLHIVCIGYHLPDGFKVEMDAMQGSISY